jgi:hypothetical protein
MLSLKGNPKIIQFLQRNKPSQLPPQLRIPDPVAEDRRSGPVTAEALHGSNPPTPAINENTPIPPNSQSPAPPPELLLPRDVSDDAPSTSAEQKKPKAAGANSLNRPATRAQTRQKQMGDSNTHVDHVSPPLTELSDEDDDAPETQAYEVDKILNFKYDDKACIFEHSLWLLTVLNACA